MTRQGLGISPRLDHDALHLRTHEKGSQNIFFTPPNAITIERKRPTPTKIPEAIWVNSPKSSADDNFAKDVIAYHEVTGRKLENYDPYEVVAKKES